VWHPETGERLGAESDALVRALRAEWEEAAEDQRAAPNCAVVVSDGLCCNALSDHGHLHPFLAQLRELLAAPGSPLRAAPHNLVVTSGRVRAGYQIGELAFGARGGSEPAAVVHVIGERPGNGQRTFSAYLTVVARDTWSVPRRVDHDQTRVVSGIADTSYDPASAAKESFAILCDMTRGVGGKFAAPVPVPGASGKHAVPDAAEAREAKRHALG